MTDDFLRILPQGDSPRVDLQVAGGNSARLAAITADLLEVLSAEWGGREDMLEWARVIREDIKSASPKLIQENIVSIADEDRIL